MSSEPQKIGIAVVELNDCYLVGIRGDVGPLPGYCEFPGGKCRAAESPDDCARRECLEETGLDVVPAELLLRRHFRYEHGDVEVFFWLCRPAHEDLVQDEHQGFRWLPVSQLPHLKFPEANQPLVELLMTRSTHCHLDRDS